MRQASVHGSSIAVGHAARKLLRSDNAGRSKATVEGNLDALLEQLGIMLFEDGKDRGQGMYVDPSSAQN